MLTKLCNITAPVTQVDTIKPVFLSGCIVGFILSICIIVTSSDFLKVLMIGLTSQWPSHYLATTSALHHVTCQSPAHYIKDWHRNRCQVMKTQSSARLHQCVIGHDVTATCISRSLTPFSVISNRLFQWMGCDNSIESDTCHWTYLSPTPGLTEMKTSFWANMA